MDAKDETGLDDYEAGLANRYVHIGKLAMFCGGLVALGSVLALLALGFPSWAFISGFVGVAMFVEGGRRWQLVHPPTEQDRYPLHPDGVNRVNQTIGRD